MGTFSFIKEAGEKPFGIGKAQTAPAAASVPDVDQMAALIKFCPDQMLRIAPA